MKKILAFALTFLCLVPLFPLCASADKPETVTLYVYNWGEYISDGSEGCLDVNAAFEDYCRDELGMDVKVNYSTFNSCEDMYAKINSGATCYDVIIPSDYMIQRMVKEKLLTPLDLSLIPNYAYIDDAFKGENVYYEDDPTDDVLYSVPYAFGMIGVIYNTTIVPEDEESIGSWELLWDGDYAGDILQYNNSRDAFGTALYYLGYDVNDASEAQWREALELLKTQKDLVQGYVMDEIFNKMKSGSAAVSSYYAGDFLSMYEDNEDLAFYYPKEGTNSYIDAMCIPYNAKHVELAHLYINFMCSEEIAVANAEYHYYASPCTHVRENEEYIECMESVHPDAMDILYNSTETVKSQAYLNLSDEKLELLNSLWEELKVESSIGTAIYVLCGIILAALLAFAVFRIIRKYRWSKLY